MIDILRGYVPTATFAWSQVVRQTPAGLAGLAGWPEVGKLSIPSDLPHRKVWAMAWSDAGAFSVDADLVFYLRGAAVYSQPIARYDTAVSNRWIAGFSTVNAWPGASTEQVFVYVAGNPLAVAPWRLNLAADAAALRLNGVGPAAAQFDLFLAVQSSQGI